MNFLALEKPTPGQEQKKYRGDLVFEKEYYLVSLNEVEHVDRFQKNRQQERSEDRPPQEGADILPFTAVLDDIEKCI